MWHAMHTRVVFGQSCDCCGLRQMLCYESKKRCWRKSKSSEKRYYATELTASSVQTSQKALVVEFLKGGLHDTLFLWSES